MDYEDRLKILKWSTLEKRRHYISLEECYKTVFSLNGLNFSDDFFELALDTHVLIILKIKSLQIFIFCSRSKGLEQPTNACS